MAACTDSFSLQAQTNLALKRFAGLHISNHQLGSTVCDKTSFCETGDTEGRPTTARPRGQTRPRCTGRRHIVTSGELARTGHCLRSGLRCAHTRTVTEMDTQRGRAGGGHDTRGTASRWGPMMHTAGRRTRPRDTSTPRTHALALASRRPWRGRSRRWDRRALPPSAAPSALHHPRTAVARHRSISLPPALLLDHHVDDVPVLHLELRRRAGARERRTLPLRANAAARGARQAGGSGGGARGA